MSYSGSITMATANGYNEDHPLVNGSLLQPHQQQQLPKQQLLPQLPQQHGGRAGREQLAEKDGAHGSSKDDKRRTDRYGFVGGDQYTDPEQEATLPRRKVVEREHKWLDMFENWEKWMTKHPKKVRDRCRKGIPASLRPLAWQYLCGAKFQEERHDGFYQGYLDQPGDPKHLADIEKDLHRSFPFHEMFAARKGHGQNDLFNVLKAYTVRRPQEGFCQAQAPIAAVLLMHIPEEAAFWCFVAICEKYIPGYYSEGLEAVKTDGDILFRLLKKVSPALHKHMRKNQIDPVICMLEWFMCIFARVLPWKAVLRVWDMFFFEGVKVLFRVALVIMKYTFESQKQLPDGILETLDMLKAKNIPKFVTEENFLVSESLKLPITDGDMLREQEYVYTQRESMDKRQLPRAAASAAVAH